MGKKEEKRNPGKEKGFLRGPFSLSKNREKNSYSTVWGK